MKLGKVFPTILMVVVMLAGSCYGQKATTTESPKPAKIDWGTCPQLAPTESDIRSKSAVLQQCLKQFPVPKAENLKPETIAQHQSSVTECALKTENWFNKNGSYKFEKAKSEIKKKKLSNDMEKALLEAHEVCEKDAKDNSTKNKLKVVDQVQLYQNCMDGQISTNCKIKILAQ